MDVGHELDFFMAQGPLFWAAAASVGLGGTLLVSSVFVWLRRRLHSAGTGMFRLRRRRPTESGPAIEVTDTGYSVEGAPRALAPHSDAAGNQPAADRQELLALLERLREAGDRLEVTLERSESADFGKPELKHSLEYDEIETRAGVC